MTPPCYDPSVYPSVRARIRTDSDAPHSSVHPTGSVRSGQRPDSGASHPPYTSDSCPGPCCPNPNRTRHMQRPVFWHTLVLGDSACARGARGDSTGFTTRASSPRSLAFFGRAVAAPSRCRSVPPGRPIHRAGRGPETGLYLAYGKTLADPAPRGSTSLSPSSDTRALRSGWRGSGPNHPASLRPGMHIGSDFPEQRVNK